MRTLVTTFAGISSEWHRRKMWDKKNAGRTEMNLKRAHPHMKLAGGMAKDLEPWDSPWFRRIEATKIC
jgi:hypothetical protein